MFNSLATAIHPTPARLWRWLDPRRRRRHASQLRPLSDSLLRDIGLTSPVIRSVGPGVPGPLPPRDHI